MKRNRRYTLEEVQKFASDRGGDCLSTSYKNAHTPLKWRCGEGHVWDTTLTTIIHRKSWCPNCAGNRPYKLSDLQDFAVGRGGELLSQEYVNTHFNYRWKCGNGHMWRATFNSLRRGDWCPHCTFNFKEEVCRLIFEKTFGEKFPRLRPRWLKNSGGNQMELDGFCKKLSIAFEYNGEHHYRSGHFSMTESALKKRKKDDQRKIKLCKEENIKLFIVKYDKPLIEVMSRVRETFKEHVIYSGEINFNEVHQHASILDELREIATDRGGKLLSNKYHNGKTSLKWECKKGHKWWASSESIIYNSSWCPKCYGNVILTIEEMKEIAQKRGGKCLSDVYVNSQTKLKWQCSDGHVWRAVPNKIKSGQWCRICSYKKINLDKKLTIQEMREIALSRGGKCLSDQYVDFHTKLLWECHLKHQWSATPGHIKTGTWCPFCSGNRKS